MERQNFFFTNNLRINNDKTQVKNILEKFKFIVLVLT